MTFVRTKMVDSQGGGYEVKSRGHRRIPDPEKAVGRGRTK